MKKLVTLVMVLSIASLATAGLQLSVDGQVAPDEITIVPSTTIVLDVMMLPDDTVMGYDLKVVVEGLGSLDEAGVNINPAGKNWMNKAAIVPGNGPQLFRWTAADVEMFGGTGQTGGKILDLLQFHCEGPQDVTITLYSVATTINGVDVNEQVVDTLTIHQIPEPATMALLGLGGLLLRRRK